MRTGTENVTSIKEIELYRTVVTPEVEFVTTDTKSRTVELKATDAGDDVQIIYTLDGTEPAADNGTVYTNAITLPDGAIRVKAAAFDGDTKVTETVSKTYLSGTPTSVGVQTNKEKISYSGSFSNNRDPYYAFDGISKLEDIARAWEYKTNIPVTVSYDAPITVDTIAMPVRIFETAFNGVKDGGSGYNSSGTKDTKTETLITDVSMSINVKYKKDGEFVDAGTKTVTLPKGSEATFIYAIEYGACWAYLPAFEFDSFTTDELQITVTDASTDYIKQIKEIEMYKSAGVVYGVDFSKPSGVYAVGGELTVSATKAGSVARYTTDGTEPTAESTPETTPLVLTRGSIVKVNAAAFKDGEKVSDTFSEIYVTGKYQSRSVQKDADRITYDSYTETNGRYPKYAFDGDASLGGAHAVWSPKTGIAVNVSYDNAIVSDAVLVGIRVSGSLVDTAALVTTQAVGMTLKVNGAEARLELPAGSAVKLHEQSDGTTTTRSYWAYIGSGDICVNSPAGGTVTYELSNVSGVDGIKEIELLKTGIMNVNISANGTGVSIIGSNSYDEDKTATVFAAGYSTDANGTPIMLDVQEISWTIPANATEETFDMAQITKSFDDAEYVKYFAWLDAETIEPLCESVKIMK